MAGPDCPAKNVLNWSFPYDTSLKYFLSDCDAGAVELNLSSKYVRFLVNAVSLNAMNMTMLLIVPLFFLNGGGAALVVICVAVNSEVRIVAKIITRRNSLVVVFITILLILY